MSSSFSSVSTSSREGIFGSESGREIGVGKGGVALDPRAKIVVLKPLFVEIIVTQMQKALLLSGRSLVVCLKQS